MAKFYQKLDDQLSIFINDQKMFFTATAAENGRINLSPKGMDTFRILSDKQVGFLSLTGSGNETAAHLLSNNRITIMFCSFDKTPLILRIYGTGQSYYPTDSNWSQISSHFEVLTGTRQIFIIDIESIQTSCGYSIPFYSFEGDRDTLIRWAEKKNPTGVKDYWMNNNLKSIDGLDTGLEEKLAN